MTPTAAKGLRTLRTLRAAPIILSLVIGIVIMVACSVSVDVANKACDSSGACGSGYVCDDLRSPKICVLPQDRLTGTGDGGGVLVPTCDPCPCTTDPDCKDPQRPRCSPSSKTCVECTTTPTDNCRPGQYCNDAFQCILGCKQESDCTISPNSPHCELTRHQCVECTATSPCADATKVCSASGSCVESCATKPCTGGRTCCTGLCLDLTTDVLNCGTCDKRCTSANGTPKCVASACDTDCANGFANCDGMPDNGCEANIRTVARCGSCTGNCNLVVNTTGLSCVTGACTFNTCAANFLDGDNNKANGCEEPCGKNGQACCAGNTCTEGSCKPPNPPKCR